MEGLVHVWVGAVCSLCQLVRANFNTLGTWEGQLLARCNCRRKRRRDKKVSLRNNLAT